MFSDDFTSRLQFCKNNDDRSANIRKTPPVLSKRIQVVLKKQCPQRCEQKILKITLHTIEHQK